MGADVVASLAGATRRPDPLPVPTRIGGFGGEDGFRATLAKLGIIAVVDATHPFADVITHRSARVCADMGLPYLHVLRPSWVPQTGDDWMFIASPRDAAAHIPEAATVFLATGRQTLDAYANLAGRRVLLRVIDPPREPFPFDGGEYVVGRPPFTQDQEKALFEALGVTHLVVKNAGGDGGRAKLDAARQLSLPVLVLERPVMPQSARVETVEDALAWVRAL
ncbi:UNVERIFIED_CONTAM: hypothetical protein GTU68_026811 [Idotea baltica]|nr:hypothetical protein [Idotea baltica]